MRGPVTICYDLRMRKASVFTVGLALCALCFAETARGQSEPGRLELAARVTPSAAKPEPVRQFTFYVLTKSYEDIVKDVEEKDPVPPRKVFIDGLKVSPELREWLKDHDTLDLTAPDLDKLLSPDDIMKVPEFLLAYERSNSGGVTKGFPKAKYTDKDKSEHPEKYQKLREEYLAAVKKFIKAYPETVSGVELELDGVNPQSKWAAIQSERNRRVQHLAPDTAQINYLAAKADTDLDGKAAISGLAPGKYWISSLNLDAAAGDMRLRWDIPVTIQAGQTTRVELTNLNSTEARSYKP
jgi:hypothetical protein